MAKGKRKGSAQKSSPKKKRIVKVYGRKKRKHRSKHAGVRLDLGLFQ